MGEEGGSDYANPNGNLGSPTGGSEEGEEGDHMERDN